MTTIVLDKPITITEESALPKTRGEVWADKILAEVRLIQYTCLNMDGERCAIGVLGDYNTAELGGFEPYLRFIDSGISETYEIYHESNIVSDNNDFIGTPEERCLYIAERLRVLI